MAGKRKLIGEIMVSLNYVSVEQINEARRAQMQGAEKRLGECLMEMGFVRPEQVEQALNIQRAESQ